MTLYINKNVYIHKINMQESTLQKFNFMIPSIQTNMSDAANRYMADINRKPVEPIDAKAVFEKAIEDRKIMDSKIKYKRGKKSRKISQAGIELDQSRKEYSHVKQLALDAKNSLVDDLETFEQNSAESYKKALIMSLKLLDERIVILNDCKKNMFSLELESQESKRNYMGLREQVSLREKNSNIEQLTDFIEEYDESEKFYNIFTDSNKVRKLN